MARISHMSILLGVLVFAPRASAQQVADTDYHFPNPHPAYASRQGPWVCIDAAHNNYPAERYEPFEALLREDGYRVRPLSRTFTPEALAECGLLVTVGPIAYGNRGDWAFPHLPAFSRMELEALLKWISAGGGLLFIADHTPFPAGGSDLGTMLGVVMADGTARLGSMHGPDVFTRGGGHLSEHAILRGRDPSERVDTVVSFVGLAFHPSREWSPLLRFGAESYVSVNLSFNFPDLPRDQWPTIPIAGWSQAAARTFGSGRVVWLGEFTICTALRGGEERAPLGMNHPAATQNAQFCLNTVRWLSRVLED